MRQAGLAQLDHGAEEARGQLLALPPRFVFLEEQVAEALFEAVDEVQGRVLGQIGQQAKALIGFEVVPMPSHQREQTAVLAARRIDLSPAGQEVVVDEPDDVEAIGDNDRLGEVLTHDGTVNHRQVHADDPNLLFAFHGMQIRLQGRFRAAERDVVDPLVFQIAESRGVALLAREEGLVDAQHLGQTGG